MRKEFKDSEEKDQVRDSVNDTKTGSGKRSKRNGRKKRNSHKGKERKEDYASNDIAWYAKNPQVLQSAASISYYTPLGGSHTFKNLPIEANGFSYPTYGELVGSYPGVMALEYIHGPASDVNQDIEPLDIAANSIYSFIRHANSGAKNYDAPDLMMYLLAMDEIYQAWAVGVRAYGLMRLYSHTNRYIPRMLVNAAGFDFEDLKGNLANFNNYLNVLAAEISAFCVPANIPYFRRHYFLASNVYVDEDVTKPQMYMYRPALYRYWSDTLSDQGSTLVANWWPYHDQVLGSDGRPYGAGFTAFFNFMNTESNPEDPYDTLAGNKARFEGLKMTFRQYQEIMDKMIYQLTGSSDVGLMSGDIKKAYGDSNLFTISPIPSDYVVVPVKNEEVLTQISNFRALTGFNWYDTEANFHNSMDIRQQVGTETQSPQIDYNPSTTYHPAKANMAMNILNFHKNDVSPEDTMIASRWLTLMSQEEVRNAGGDLLGYKYSFNSLGSEFGCGIYMYQIVPDGASESMSGGSDVYTEFVRHLTSFIGTSPECERITSAVSNFDWHMPLFNCVLPSNPTADCIIDHMNLDVAVFAYPGSQAIHNMNQAAILSLFDVPEIGKF